MENNVSDVENHFISQNVFCFVCTVKGEEKCIYFYRTIIDKTRYRKTNISIYLSIDQFTRTKRLTNRGPSV